MFLQVDPILSASQGDVLEIKPECSGFYLFCEATPNFWIDTAPVHTNTLGNWNRRVLTAMGSRPRGFSAHRAGFVGRACVLALLKGEGVELSQDTVDVIARLGGWSPRSGKDTVMSVYARQDIDVYADPYCLSMGVEVAPKEWRRRKEDYIGQPMHPAAPVVDHGRDLLPLQLRLLSWRSAVWTAFQQHLNTVVASIMSAGKDTEFVLPVHRYRQARRVFSVYIKSHPTVPAVVEYKELLSKRRSLWADCLTRTSQQCHLDFKSHNRSLLAGRRRGIKFGRMLAFLCVLHIGFVTPEGEVLFCSNAQLQWLQAGKCVWVFQAKGA